MAAVAAVLVALVLIWTLGSQPSRLVGQSSAASSSNAGRSFVQVNGASLIGQPVGAVRQQLRQLGLVVGTRWLPSDQQPPGTVLSVLPAGRVRVGSLVVLTGALQPGGNGNGDGGGNGNGGGDGGGGNGGGGN